MSSAKVESCQTKAIALLLLVFLGGVGTGIIGARAYDRHVAAAAAHDGHLHETQQLAQRLRSDLSLAAEQAAKVEAILDECIMAEADLLYQIRTLKAEGRERILAVLNDEQKAKFQALLTAGEGF